MRREQFEHVVRAAAEITGDEIVVVGSQAVLGQFADAPEMLVASIEADLYPRRDPARAIEIDGVLGDGSSFHESFGYYAHGVGPETPVAPAGWEVRLIEITLPAMIPSKGEVTAWCMEIHDVVLAKLAAGRHKDVEYAVAAVRGGIADPGRLERGLELMPESHRDVTADRLRVVLRRASADQSSP